MKPERKIYAFKGAITDNVIKGAANAIGNMDRGGDVVCPGFFTDALEAFRKQGFVAVGHDWESLPVAMPTLVEEREGQLYSEAVYHSTTAAQDARTVAVERIQNALDVGLSIGFALKPTGYKVFSSGDELLKWLPEGGYDVKQFDAASITAWKTRCRALIKCDELYEYSQVSVPMNPKAVASEAKFWTYWTDENQTAADVTVAALNSLYYDLCDDVAMSLYGKGTPAEIVAALTPTFQNFSDRSLAVISALMTILSDADDATKSRIVASVQKMAAGRAVTSAPAAIPPAVDIPVQGDAVKSALSRTYSILAATAAL